MSKRVFEEELGRETVFRDAGKLLPDYVPPALVHRDEEFRLLTQFFRPVIDSRASQRALVTGSTGVGKTSLAMKFGEEFKSAGSGKKLNLDYLHINCRKEKTIHAVFMKLVHHYNPRWPYRGLGPEKLLDMVAKFLEAHDTRLLLTLDELDYFIQLNGPDILYTLTRVAEEHGGKSRISLIAIARDKNEFLRLLDPPTQSTFLHNVLPLSKYNDEQLLDIMNRRVPEAFRAGAVDPETVELIADVASRWGDARLALELLWRAGMVADREGSDSVLPEHARQAKAEVYPEIRKESLQELMFHEKLLLLALARRLRISKQAYALTGEVEKAYAVVCEEYGEEPMRHTPFWGHMKRLGELGLAEVRPSGLGHKGRSMAMSIPEVPVAWIEKELVRLLKG
ncbi:MAG: ORC1-type DNA replication protein [Candidatus Hadarchaeota archaeon]